MRLRCVVKKAYLLTPLYSHFVS